MCAGEGTLTRGEEGRGRGLSTAYIFLRFFILSSPDDNHLGRFEGWAVW